MSAQRISVPGEPTRFIDLGPSTGRRTFTRGMVYGGALVVSQPRKRTVDQERAARQVELQRAADRRYYAAHRERLLQEQREKRAALRVPCGKWMILARVECARKARHGGACASRSAMDAENRADRKRMGGL